MRIVLRPALLGWLCNIHQNLASLCRRGARPILVLSLRITFSVLLLDYSSFFGKLLDLTPKVVVLSLQLLLLLQAVLAQ